MTCSPPPTVTVRPSAAASTSSNVVAIPSTAPASTASLAGDDFASRTVAIAHSALRPRVSAIDRMLAIASLSTFSPSVPSMSSPPPPTGEAAPIRVPGAMNATFEASVMNVPALAA